MWNWALKARRTVLLPSRSSTAGPSDSVFVALFRTDVEEASRGAHNIMASRWRGPHLPNTVGLAVADGLLGLYGSERMDELFIGT